MTGLAVEKSRIPTEIKRRGIKIQRPGEWTPPLMRFHAVPARPKLSFFYPLILILSFVCSFTVLYLAWSVLE